VENLLFVDEYKKWPKDEFALLVNAQRLLTALGAKNPWEGEIKYVKAKNDQLLKDVSELKKKLDIM
jgi:hypothetical protein